MRVKEFKDKKGRRILTCAIMSTKFLSNLSATWNSEGMFPSNWENLVATWCVDYFKQYGKAPRKNIQGIFQNWEEKTSDKNTADIVQRFLSGLSEEFEETNGKINSKYEIEQAKPYFLENEATQLITKIQGAIDTRKYENIIQHVKEFREPVLGTDSEDIHLFNDPSTWECMYKEKDDLLITYPGALGEFFGYSLSRGNFVSFLAPEKRGKCVSEDMKVPLVDGRVKTIRCIVENKIKTPIIALNEETQRFEPAVVSDFWENGIKECFELRTKSGKRITTTENHKYLTPDGWKNLHEIKSGEFIAVFETMNGTLAYDKYLNSCVSWDEVKSIESVGDRKTYDLTVPKHHNFVCNDCVVHNTFLLMDMAFQGVLKRRRVAFFEVGDMTREQISRRFAVRACEHPWRPKKVRIPIRISVDKMGHHVDFKEKNFDDYLQLKILGEGFKTLKERVKSEKTLFKMRVFPAATLTVQHLKNIVEMWARDGWVPDVIVIDYVDLLGSASRSTDVREKINDIWIGLRSLSQTMNCLVVTATQANRASYNVKHIGMEHSSEDKRKNAHVTGIVAINQTPEEKKDQVYRLGWSVLREEEFHSGDEVYVAGCLSLAHPTIISCFNRPVLKNSNNSGDTE